jgi:hypothetical protein
MAASGTEKNFKRRGRFFVEGYYRRKRYCEDQNVEENLLSRRTIAASGTEKNFKRRGGFFVQRYYRCKQYVLQRTVMLKRILY